MSFLFSSTPSKPLYSSSLVKQAEAVLFRGLIFRSTETGERTVKSRQLTLSFKIHAGNIRFSDQQAASRFVHGLVPATRGRPKRAR
ncbi:hypothetical protein OPV22_014302 [Ensete ventricosum]|uniref:Uncharacterized protein n=1 Tax=Ensete ventricosum TaxID=4639 RepID=A0AAV8R6U2_ENSVE|nr:hypothetical protein OPV22_014302 [Ensete ventricosum]